MVKNKVDKFTMVNQTCLLEHFCNAYVIRVCQSNVKLVTDENKYRHSFVVCAIADCKLFYNISTFRHGI